MDKQTPNTYGQRIAFARKNIKKVSQEELGKLAGGLKQGTISGLESGKSDSTSSALEIARALGVSVDWLLTGKGEMNTPMTTIRQTSEFRQPNDTRDGYIYLDLLDVQAAAGNGVEMIEHPSVVTKMEIQEEWAQRTFGGDLSRIMLITARGTSMSGTIENGDVLFVDSTVREYDGEGIYVIARGREVLVKRLQKLHGNRLEIISDNPNNRSETLDETQANEVIICGRVLKAWTIKNFW